MQLLKDKNAWIPARIKLSEYGFIGIFFMIAMAKYVILAEIEIFVFVIKNENT